MIAEEVLVIFKKYIPTKLWENCSHVAIVFKDNSLLKWIGVHQNWYRNYYLKVTCKNQTIARFRLSLEDKNLLKQHVKKFNESLNK
jgi:hypothetical protein